MTVRDEDIRGDERLTQNPTQSRYLWFDQQVVPDTGFETLNERLWEPLLSVAGATDPRRGLRNLRLVAALDLYTTNLPMTVYAAGPGYSAGIDRAWTPSQGGLLVELEPLESGGAAVFAQSTGHVPGLRGRLNPIRDTSDRTYLYADNIAIDEGRQQPVPFRLGKPMRLTDAHGAELSVTIVDIVGRSSLLEYRPYQP